MFNNDCNNGKSYNIYATDNCRHFAYCVCFTASNMDSIQMRLEQIAYNSGNKQMH